MKFLVHHEGSDLGPFSLDEMRQGVACGSLHPDDLAWQEGAPEWLPLCSIPGATLGAPPAAAPAPLSPTPGRTSSLAIASLVLGIMSLGGGMLFSGIPAVICGHLARAQIKKAPGPLKGEGVALAGLITGYLGTLLISAVFATLGYGVLVVVKDSNHSRESITQAQEIARACQTFSVDHGGKLPGSLEDLVPDYLQDQRWLADPGQPGSTEIGYYYYGTGRFEADSLNKVLLASKAIYSRRRVVVRFNGRARLETFSPPIE